VFLVCNCVAGLANYDDIIASSERGWSMVTYSCIVDCVNSKHGIVKFHESLCALDYTRALLGRHNKTIQGWLRKRKYYHRYKCFTVLKWNWSFCSIKNIIQLIIRTTAFWAMINLVMKAVIICETSGIFYETTMHSTPIPKGCLFHARPPWEPEISPCNYT
jgi:hypothetical protein